MQRIEHKYLVPEPLIGRLRRAIAPFVRPDERATLRDGETRAGYRVHSIYFDTSRLTNYYQTTDGVERRAKLRIRGYDRYKPGDCVILEVKRRNGLVSSKQRAPTPFAGLQRLLATGDVDSLVRPTADTPDAVAHARHFLFRLRRDALQPVVLVVYDREPYVGLSDQSLRVTFDRSVRSVAFPALDALFDPLGARMSYPGHFILEVKYDARFTFPLWLRPFLTEHRLTRQGLSKYRASVAEQRLGLAGARTRVLGSAARPVARPFVEAGGRDMRAAVA